MRLLNLPDRQTWPLRTLVNAKRMIFMPSAISWLAIGSDRLSRAEASSPRIRVGAGPVSADDSKNMEGGR